MENETLNKITLIIPTFNRYEFLFRILSYYQSFKTQLRILILDSSTIPIDKNRFAEFLDNPNIIFIPYDEKIFSNEKIADGVRKVETPYTFVCGDDDFVILDSAIKAVKFLEENDDYSIAHGYSGQFISDVKGGEKKINAVSSYFQDSLEEKSASERLIKFLNNYFATFYSVHRTKDLQKNMDLLCAKEFMWGFKELFLSCSSVIQGKVKMLDCLYLLREAHYQKDSDEHKEILDPFGSITALDFGKNYAKFSESLAEEIVKEDNIDLDEALSVVKQAFWAYTNKSLLSGYNSKYVNRSGIREKAKCFVMKNNFLKKGLTTGLNILRANNLSVENVSLPALLNKRSPFHKEFMLVYNACGVETGNRKM